MLAIVKFWHPNQLATMTKLLAILACCYSSIGFSTTNNEFNNFFNSFESLSANFKQHTLSEPGALIGTTYGSVLLKRPKQLLWHTKTPSEQILSLNNNELWIVDTELEQASLQKIDNLNQTPLYYLINRPSDINTTPGFSHQKNKINWYKTNKANNLSFGFKDSSLYVISVDNELGQKILLSLSSVRLNPTIDSKEFTLKINPEFDIIR